MSQPQNMKTGSKKTSSSGRARTIDARVAIARLYHYHRLQQEAALRLRPEAAQYTPRMDLYDDAALPHVSAMLELPGVDRRTLSLQVQGAKLVVHGERASPLAAKLHGAAGAGGAGVQGAAATTAAVPHMFKTRELKFGSFHREIDVPVGIDTNQITAELSDGMLLITWPRTSTFAAGRANARAA
ncbi:Hsp20/alpha crystallin family protein [Phanerochaete sordida]|uniref:Hsp20/alpha crystallin family protein n=1 Tax=Phanerochaete sordida TaxID=48140 RepID=A0A9P3G1T6_9APHY|nr:Hsp20/alpha crystallin family protein [Phanerochaete sordida]